MVRRSLALLVGGAVLLAGCGKEDDGGGGAPEPTLDVVSDAEWCAGWQEMVAVQGQYVAQPTPEAADALLTIVDSLRALGVPESLDPNGYTELTAVLDDVRASADPSFTPSVVPSEPADVGLGHDHGDEGEAENEHRAAPFGTWLADYCAS